MSAIRIGTRASQLAQWQAYWCANVLKKQGIAVEVVLITTSGDRFLPTSPLAAITQGTAQGVFTREIQDALLDGRIDLAVHSLKDLPTEAVPGLCLAAVPERAQIADVLVARVDFPTSVTGLESLPDGAILGTSSLRRQAQLRAFARLHGRTWDIRGIRGNLNTRLRKLDEGQFDVLVLARAGVERLALSHRISAEIPTGALMPAVGQGALGLETRENDESTREVLARFLHHAPTFACVTAERTMLLALDGGCATPIGVTCENLSDGSLRLCGRVIAVDGRTFLQFEATGADPVALGQTVARELLSQGADALISEARNLH